MIDKFLGLKNSEIDSWSHEYVSRSPYYRSERDMYGKIVEGRFFLAALPDNEGILILTSNFDWASPVDRITVNRIYKNNWFYVGVFNIPRLRKRFYRKWSFLLNFRLPSLISTHKYYQQASFGGLS